MPPDRMTRRIFAAMAVAVAVAAIEAGAAFTTGRLVARGWMAEIPRFTTQQVAAYFTLADPMLGWRPASQAAGGDACASAYGDSFTAGDGDPENYPFQLGQLLGCRVNNHGVGGYGSDQALMLAADDASTDPSLTRISILGHVSENILRNVNQYRNLLYPGQPLFFKPRYVLDAGDRLVRVGPVIRTPEDFRALMTAPEQLLEHEAFLSRPRRQFPHTATVIRWLFADFHVRAKLAGVPRHLPFYETGHAAGGLPLTTKILSTFSQQTRGGLIVLIPVGDDFLYARRTGRWPDQPLADALSGANIDFVHAGPVMLRRLGEADPCSLFGDCNGHYNARGYRMLAEVIADAIRDAGQWPPRAPGSP